VVLAQRPSPGTPIAPGAALVVAIALPLPNPRRPAPPTASAVAVAVIEPRLPSVSAASLRRPSGGTEACGRASGWGGGWGAYRC
jgi:hypothetical protein